MSADKTDGIHVPAPQIERACAIVVLFHPELYFKERLQSLLNQFKSVILVDNTPGNASLGGLPESVQVVRNGRNLGVATALNRGVCLALKLGYTWIATFDQDSDLLPGYLETVIATAGQYTPKPAIIGCNYFIGDSDKVRHAVRSSSTGIRPRVMLITSGSFMPVQFVRDIGGFCDDYFIDSVDHEFCLRARHYGAVILMTTQPLMCHRIGEASVGFGRAFSFQHSPVRRYYISRNALATIRSYGSQYPLWAARQVSRLTAEAFSIIFFESRKLEKLTFFLRGLWHGISGRSGPLEDA